MGSRRSLGLWAAAGVIWAGMAGGVNVRGQERAKPAQSTVQSKVLGEQRRIIVRLPRRYEADTATRYPVLYKFDGDNGLGRYDESIDVLSSFDAMPDMIVVAIPNGPGMRNRDLTPASLHQDEGGTGEMGRGDRFLDFIEQELIPLVDQQYRTTQERVLAGHSRGALLVLQSLLNKPDLFQGRFLFSAPLMREDQRMIHDTRKFLKERRGHKSFVYCNWGEIENEGMNQSYLTMKGLLASEAPAGLRWTIERARGGDHQQTPLIALPSALYEYFGGRRADVNGALGNQLGRATNEGSRRKVK